MTTKKQPVWKVAKPRKSYASGVLMYRIEGPEIVGDYEDWGYTKTDAQLMAASAELLSALKVVLSESYDGPLHDDFRSQARAAIAKAEGV